MKYRKFGDTIIVRIDRGEEVTEQVMRIVKLENIRLGSVSAIGSTDSVTAGVFKPTEKKYYPNDFTGDFEIVSLTGNISTMKGKPYVHLHISFADDKGNVFGGHLNSARISATCEMIITVLHGTADRFKSPEVGLNIYDF